MRPNRQHRHNFAIKALLLVMKNKMEDVQHEQRQGRL